MSHIVEAKTSIINPNRELLAQAVGLVAQQHHGTVRTEYKDFYSRPHPVSTGLAIYTQEMHRGVGIEVNAVGELSFVGDPWNVRELFAQIQQEVVQAYVAFASMQALQQLGYTTQAIDGPNREIVIQGASYA